VQTILVESVQCDSTLQLWNNFSVYLTFNDKYNFTPNKIYKGHQTLGGLTWFVKKTT
jgi:hypothetical protein